MASTVPNSKRLDHLKRDLIFRGNDSAFWVDVVTLDRDLGWAHDHDFAEIVLVRSGRGLHVTAFGEATLGAGDCLILLPGAWHTYRRCRALEVVNCCFRPEIVHQELAAFQHDLALCNLLGNAGSTPHTAPLHLKLSRSIMAQCDHQLMAMRPLLFQDSAAARVRARAAFLWLLALIGESLGVEERKRLEQMGQIPTAVSNALAFIEHDLSLSWKLEELAARAHLDAFYLVRLFKKFVGEPPLQYQTRRRAEQAARLLATTSLPIAEIGAQVGWDSPAYFARRFKAHFEMSAGEFRKRSLTSLAAPQNKEDASK